MLFSYDASFIIAMTLCMLISSGLFDLVPNGEWIRSTAIICVLLLSIAGIVWAFMLGELRTAAVSTMFLGSIWLYLDIYAVRFGQPFVSTAGGLFFGGALSALFVPVLRGRTVNGAFDYLLRVILAYALIYIVATWALEAGVIRGQTNSSLVISADQLIGRNERLVLAASFIVFGLAVSLVRFINTFRISHLSTVAVFASSLFMSNSRGIIAITVAVIGLYAVTRSVRKVSLVAIIVFMVGALLSLYVLFTPDVNPLTMASHDTSVSVRLLSIQIAQSLVHDFWIFGAGIPSGGAGYVAATGSKIFFTADIGMMGVTFNYGIFGFLVYSLIAYVACTSWECLRAIGVKRPIAEGLGLTGAIFAIYSLQAPEFAGGYATAFASLFIAAVFVQRGRTPMRQRKPSQDLARPLDRYSPADTAVGGWSGEYPIP